MSNQDVYKRRYGHGSITLTHYRGSGRVSVETNGTNPVMDFTDLIEFVSASGWLNSVKAKAWDEGFDAGEKDAMQHVTFNEPCIENPYRTGGAE